MTEGRNSCKIEAMLPNAKRPSIFMTTEEDVKTIIALHNDIAGIGTLESLHELETGCLIRHIQIPNNADLTIVSAEYKQGMLKVLLSKSTTVL